jgi:hypothetical protein
VNAAGARGVEQDLALLLDERAIGRQLTAFARAMDERDWAALDALVAADATADVGTGSLQHGRAAIVALMRSFLDDCGPTQHLLGNLVIDVTGDEATSRCYVADLHVGAGAKSHLTLQSLGDYHDRWRRLDGRWQLVHRTKLNRALVGTLEVLGAGPADWRD